MRTDHLDEDRADERGYDRAWDREHIVWGKPKCSGGQPSERYPRQRDVADAVSHERHAPLNEVGSNDGRGQPHEHRHDQRALHEWGRKHLDHDVSVRRTGAWWGVGVSSVW